MRLKLRLSQETEDAVRPELAVRDIEVTEEASLILTEDAYHAGRLICHDNNEMVVVPLAQVCHIETRGRNVIVHANGQSLTIDLRLYRLEALLPREDFIRISNAVIIRRDAITRITPALSCKFHLTLTDGSRVDVTRTYYYQFKEFYGI